MPLYQHPHINMNNQPPINPRSNIFVALWLIVILAAAACVLLPSCSANAYQESSAKVCTDYYRDYNLIPSRVIMEETGVTVIPSVITAINSDGTLELMCFPGRGLCRRVCPQSIPSYTVNQYNKRKVIHWDSLGFVGAVGDTVWAVYYEGFF